MRNLLSALGYIGKTYDSAKTFLNCASTCQASCLVLDVQLGDISGIELAHRLAADGFRFPIIFMTGLDDATIREQAIAAGGIAFLRKPFSAETLADAITKAVDTGLSPRQTITSQSSRQSRQFPHLINADKVFGTHVDQSLGGRLST
jgi:FixJ family two-component response regulator